MRGQIRLDGWSHLRGIVLRPGLISNVYRHAQTQWTAHETYKGVGNGKHEGFVGIVIHDETGAFVGTVQNIGELP